MHMKTLRLYGCGGAGVNIIAKYIGIEQEVGCAIIKPAVMDTSESNLRKVTSKSDVECYLLEDADGSGKIRASNVDDILSNIKPALMKVQPGDFNIVIFSGGGGSGNVFGAGIVGELLERDLPVVAIMIGCYESDIATTNTLNTLRTLESIAEDSDKPINVSYHANNKSRSETDKKINAVIAALSVMASGANDELDSEDVNNFVYHNKISGESGRIFMLDVLTSNEELAKVKDPLTLLSLYNHPDAPRAGVPVPYIAEGFTDLKRLDVDALHFVITDNVEPEVKTLSEHLTRFKEAKEARKTRSSLTDGVVKGKKGFVL